MRLSVTFQYRPPSKELDAPAKQRERLKHMVSALTTRSIVEAAESTSVCVYTTKNIYDMHRFISRVRLLRLRERRVALDCSFGRSLTPCRQLKLVSRRTHMSGFITLSNTSMPADATKTMLSGISSGECNTE